MRRGVDIVFRPRIWDHGALTFSFEARPIFRATAAGRVATPPTPTPPHVSTTSTLDCPISLAYTMRKFWDTEQQTSANGTLLRRIYISLVLRTVTHLWLTEWISVRLRRCINEYLVPFKGTVRTPTIASVTAHLESGVLALFIRNSTILPNYWGREETQPDLLQPHHMPVSPRRLVLQFCWST